MSLRADEEIQIEMSQEDINNGLVCRYAMANDNTPLEWKTLGSDLKIPAGTIPAPCEKLHVWVGGPDVKDFPIMIMALTVSHEPRTGPDPAAAAAEAWGGDRRHETLVQYVSFLEACELKTLHDFQAKNPTQEAWITRSEAHAACRLRYCKLTNIEIPFYDVAKAYVENRISQNSVDYNEIRTLRVRVVRCLQAVATETGDKKQRLDAGGAVLYAYIDAYVKVAELAELRGDAEAAASGRISAEAHDMLTVVLTAAVCEVDAQSEPKLPDEIVSSMATIFCNNSSSDHHNKKNVEILRKIQANVRGYLNATITGTGVDEIKTWAKEVSGSEDPAIAMTVVKTSGLVDAFIEQAVYDFMEGPVDAKHVMALRAKGGLVKLKQEEISDLLFNL